VGTTEAIIIAQDGNNHIIRVVASAGGQSHTYTLTRPTTTCMHPRAKWEDTITPVSPSLITITAGTTQVFPASDINRAI
jgi:hypothetical protein